MIYENPLTGQYIRFVRGTEANWARLTNKNADTLYFIVDSTGQSGKLYLGSILIGGTSSGSVSQSVALSDLTDVLITAVANRDILVYNSSTGKWVPESVDSLVASAIANVNRLQYSIVQSIAAIDTTAADADQYIYLVPKTGTTNDSYDEYMFINGSLEKIGDWDVDLSDYVTTEVFEQRVGTLEDIINDTVDSQTGDTIPGLDTRVGNIEDLIENDTFVLTSVYQAEVGDLTQLINSTSSQNPTLVDQVNNLTERLTWYEITEENNE